MLPEILQILLQLLLHSLINDFINPLTHPPFQGLLHLSAFSVEPLFPTKTKTFNFAAAAQDLSSFSSFLAESSKSSPITLIGLPALYQSG